MPSPRCPKSCMLLIGRLYDCGLACIATECLMTHETLAAKYRQLCYAETYTVLHAAHRWYPATDSALPIINHHLISSAVDTVPMTLYSAMLSAHNWLYGQIAKQACKHEIPRCIAQDERSCLMIRRVFMLLAFASHVSLPAECRRTCEY